MRCIIRTVSPDPVRNRHPDHWLDYCIIDCRCCEKGFNQTRDEPKTFQCYWPSLNIENIISEVVLWLILIIAVIGALNVLNLTSVSGPFSSMASRVLVVYTTIVGCCCCWCFIGWIVAKLVKVGLQKGLDRTQLDEKLSQDVGVSTLSQNISEIVYWLILLLFLPIVLSILGLLGWPFLSKICVNEARTVSTKYLTAGVIVFAGYILAKIVRYIIEGLFDKPRCIKNRVEKVGLFKNLRFG